MIRIYTEEKDWDGIVKSFPGWSVYYLFGYCRALQIHGDGVPQLIYFEKGDFRLCYAVMLSDISDADQFRGRLEENRFFDWSTPYGYGGPIYEGIPEKETLDVFFEELKKYCLESGIVSQFVRFCPWTKNDSPFHDHMHVKKMKKTVYMDLASETEIFANLDSKNRNMVRKAMHHEISIVSDAGENIDQFIEVYNQTMENNHASDYFYFGKKYFSTLLDSMAGSLKVFYAVCQGQIIGGAIILFEDTVMHYHLSGTLKEFRNLASGNLLLYEAAVWGCRNGMKLFHLGGGIDEGDSLFSYKKSFYKNGILDFYVGCSIFDREKEKHLIEVRKNSSDGFNENNPFLIKYRG